MSEQLLLFDYFAFGVGINDKFVLGVIDIVGRRVAELNYVVKGMKVRRPILMGLVIVYLGLAFK